MSVLELFSPERVDERAKQVDPAEAMRKLGYAFKAVLALFLGTLGWLVGAGVRVFFSFLSAVVWMLSAVAEGYSAGRRKQARDE